MFKLKNIKYKNILDIKLMSIEAEKVTCIVGESGSGKTTLLKTLNKMITIDSGEIYYKKKLISNINSVDLRREVVMLPQVPVVFEGTVKDNLLIGLKFSKKPEVSDKKLLEVLEMINLKKNLEDDTKNFSGGEKQRLALGRVLLLEPKVLLLDEPSSSLDSNTELFIIQSLVKYAKNNKTTLVMITHSKDIANSYSDVVIEISKGKIVR